MNRTFSITAASERVTVGGDGRGEITFTVTNSSARPLSGLLSVRPLGETKGEWLSVAGETERVFSPNATQQVVVNVATPPEAPARKYQFRLDAVSAINPDGDFTEGPTVDLEVKAAEAQKKAFPWWIVAAAGGALILIVTLTWLLWPKSVEVPDVVGLDIEEAKKKFEDLNLKLEITRQPNASVTRDRVFGQDPKGKSIAEAGAPVMLLVAAEGAEVASKPAPAATPVPSPTIRKCAPQVFRIESELTWVEFRLPEYDPGYTKMIGSWNYVKKVDSKCYRVWWDDLHFSCEKTTGVWERIIGNWGADASCLSRIGSSPSPYVVTGDK